MNVCVIIMGNDPGNRIPSSAIADAEDNFAATVNGCSPGCVPTQRVIASTLVNSGGASPLQYLRHPELKPSELYVLTFPDSGHADQWMSSHASFLSGKTVYCIDPSLVNDV
jgi:hypothetical protein